MSLHSGAEQKARPLRRRRPHYGSVCVFVCGGGQLVDVFSVIQRTTVVSKGPAAAHRELAGDAARFRRLPATTRVFLRHLAFVKVIPTSRWQVLLSGSNAVKDRLYFDMQIYCNPDSDVE